MKHFFASIVFGLISLNGICQNDADIYRYSKVYTNGTARFEAMGGAFGALGADPSSVQVNPAGMGRFSSSQFSISIGPTITSSNATFQGVETTQNKTSFSLPNIALVFTNDLSRKNNGDLYGQFSIGMNRIANFNQKVNYTGEQYESLLDEFTGQAEGYDPTLLYTFFPFSTSLAWESYAIDYDQGSSSYYSQLNDDDMIHNRSIENRGGINEWYLSYSRNRLNKLYYGASISLRTSKFTEKYTHSEDMTNPTGTTFRGFDYIYELETKGTGINVKIGAIYLVNNNFRIGTSFHTPTFTELTDKWTANMISRFDDSVKLVPEELVPTGQYKYRINTPLKANVSLSYVIGFSACISADIEYIGYNLGRLKSTRDGTYEPYDFKVENEEAKKRLQSTMNYRIGFEYNIQQKLFLRAGFSYYGSAYKKSEQVETKPDISISGGLGYKVGPFNIDLAYVNRMINRNYFAFPGSSAQINSSVNNIIITGSFRF